MPRPFTCTLTDAVRITLQEARAHHPKPYVRERAAAILKVADGHSIRHVAAHGLLMPRRRETVKAWLTAYLTRGLIGLVVAPGRGRKPAFSPSLPDRASRPCGAPADPAPIAAHAWDGPAALDLAELAPDPLVATCAAR